MNAMDTAGTERENYEVDFLIGSENMRYNCFKFISKLRPHGRSPVGSFFRLLSWKLSGKLTNTLSPRNNFSPLAIAVPNSDLVELG